MGKQVVKQASTQPQISVKHTEACVLLCHPSLSEDPSILQPQHMANRSMFWVPAFPHPAVLLAVRTRAAILPCYEPQSHTHTCRGLLRHALPCRVSHRDEVPNGHAACEAVGCPDGLALIIIQQPSINQRLGSQRQARWVQRQWGVLWEKEAGVKVARGRVSEQGSGRESAMLQKLSCRRKTVPCFATTTA
jgi:hypothetical protein